MENKGILTKILAIAGIVLVWLPILAPVLFSLLLLIQRQIFRIDYLMPAELGLFAFGGGILLLVAAIRARSRQGIIAWGFGIAAAMLLGGQALAVVTGLALGEPSWSTGGGRLFLARWSSTRWRLLGLALAESCCCAIYSSLISSQ